MDDPLDRRCGSCARFVRVVTTTDAHGQTKRSGECLLGVWPSPLFETSTCSQWIRRGDFKARPETAPRPARAERSGGSRAPREALRDKLPPAPLALPEDLLEMDAKEFKRVLASVLRDELGVGEVEIAGRWGGGEMILKPGKDGLADKHIPIESLFHKVVMIRDRLRVLEQKINTNPKLDADDKLQLQQYVTGCYGSLTTFNVLFANREDNFVGQKGED